MGILVGVLKCFVVVLFGLAGLVGVVFFVAGWWWVVVSCVF